MAISWTTSGFQKRPSPPITRKEPAGLGQRERGGRCAAAFLTLDSLRDREENARDEGLAVVRLLEDGDLFAQARAVNVKRCVSCRPTADSENHEMEVGGLELIVPGAVRERRTCPASGPEKA